MHRDRRSTWGGRNVTRLVALSFGLMAVAAAQAGPPPQYTAQVIQHECGPPFSPALTVGTGLSSSGEVCGYHWPCDGPIEEIGFVWTAETGIVSIPVPPGVVVATPADINDSGQLTGKVRLTSGFERGFLLSDGEWTLIDPLCASEHSYGTALNANAAFIGGRWSALGCTASLWSYLYHGGAISDIVPPQGSVIDIRDVGIENEVPGVLDGVKRSDDQPALWSAGRFTYLAALPGMTQCVTNAINQCSTIVGQQTLAQECGVYTSAVVWNHAIAVQLPALPDHVDAFAYDISSEQDVIVGASSDGTTIGYGRAVLWRDGKVYDLNALLDPASFDLVAATSISSTGQILCSAVNPSGHVFAALLTPSQTLIGDFDDDGTVGGLDIAVLLAVWGPCDDPCSCPMDLDDNQIVNGFDLAILLANWR